MALELLKKYWFSCLAMSALQWVNEYSTVLTAVPGWLWLLQYQLNIFIYEQAALRTLLSIC